MRELGEQKVAANERNIQILVEGPFGLPTVDFRDENYQVYMMITGGIGMCFVTVTVYIYLLPIKLDLHVVRSNPFYCL